MSQFIETIQLLMAGFEIWSFTRNDLSEPDGRFWESETIPAWQRSYVSLKDWNRAS